MPSLLSTHLRRLATAASAACLVLSLWHAIAARHEAQARAVAEATTLAATLEREIAQDVRVFDLGLREAAAMAQGEAPMPRGIAWTHKLIAQYVDFLARMNEAGDVIADTRAPAPKPANYIARDYFQAHLRDGSDMLAAGAPFNPGPYQKFALSRRLTGSNGRFSGVIVAGIRLSWAQAILAGHAPGPFTTLTLRRDDGTILARLPFDRDAIGRGAASNGAPEDPDGQTHIVRRIAGAPLAVEVALGAGALTDAPIWPVFLPPLPLLCLLALLEALRRAEHRCVRIAAAASEAEAARIRQFASMSHDLRTPLTGLVGQLDLLRGEGGLNERQADRVARLTEAGAMLRRVINRVLDLTHPANRTIPPRPELCDLTGLAGSCLGVMEASAAAKGLRLDGQIDPGVPDQAVLDRGMTERVLGNLLSNAVKFTAHGVVGLRVTGGAAGLRFTVTDTGPGIAAGKRERLFGGYDRLDARGEGSGLGLWIARDLVTAMGGRICHADNPAGGSVFWFEVPVQAAAPLEPVRPEPERPAEPGPPHRPARTVLLADDVPMTREVTRDFLCAAGHRVVDVPDGEAALEAMAAQDLDLLITDMRMPGLDGLETARRVRAMPGDRGRTPIVLLTADPSARDRPGWQAAGIDLLVRKPFTRAELLDAMEAAARLAQPSAGGKLPLVDGAVLDQLAASIGPQTRDTHLRAIAARIEALLRLLPRPNSAETRDAAHDLTGMAGVLGLSALGARLAGFETAPDPAAAADALRTVAEATLLALRARE